MKICTKCKIEKPDSEFYKNSSHKGGLNSWCKTCTIESQLEYKKHNIDKINETKRKYRLENQKQIQESDRKFYQNNKEKRKENSRKYGISHKEKINENNHNRYINDINYKLCRILRNRISKAIKYNYKAGSSVKDLGCTIEELKAHLKSLFQPGMTWDNWTIDGWHIDHIIPLASFDLTDREQFLKANHYTNLQPLWAEDNLSKGDKILMADRIDDGSVIEES